jgi:hypothetical protein
VRAHWAEETCHRVASWFRIATRWPSPSQPQVFVSTRVQSTSEVQARQQRALAGLDGSAQEAGVMLMHWKTPPSERTQGGSCVSGMDE